MTAIPEAKDGHLPRVHGAETTVGSDLTLATKAMLGSAQGQLVALYRGVAPPLPVAARPPVVAALPRKVGPAPFDYTPLKSDDAEFLRKGAARIREAIKSTMGAVCNIGANLYRAKQILPHGQFVQWVESECGFSLRSAENYIRASVFADGKFATVANLSPATMYLLSAKKAPPQVVSDVLVRAASGEPVSCGEVRRLFRAAKAGEKRVASKKTQNKSRRAQPQHEGASSAANNEIARANAQALFDRFGRDGAVFLLGMEENIVETLSFLAQEIGNSDGPDEGTPPSTRRSLLVSAPPRLGSTEERDTEERDKDRGGDHGADHDRTKMESREEEKMDADRRTAHGAGIAAKLDVRGTPAREAMGKPRGRPFERGKSCNPNGRPRGHRNKATMAIEELLDGEAEQLTRKVIEKALEGDTTALRLCLDRLLPPRRERPIAFDLPEIQTAQDATAASSAILAACSAGTLSPGEAREVMELVSSYVRMLETTELEAEIAALENERMPQP